MRLHFAVVPVFGGEADAESLDRFLSSHRVGNGRASARTRSVSCGRTEREGALG